MDLAQRSALFAELRLAGASTFEAVETIQAAQTAERAIELGSKVWEHERRDAHGRFSRGGGLTGGGHSEARRQRRAELKRTGRIEAEQKQASEKPATMKQLVAVHNQVTPIAQEAAAQAANHAFQQAKEIHAEAQRLAKIQEGKKAKTKGIGMIGSLVAGAVLGYIESKTGMPGMAQIATTVTPAIAEAAFEWKKQL